MDLFGHQAKQRLKTIAPLAERMRPRTLGDYVGQRALLGEGSALRRLLEKGEVPSMILWGPPGTGKTTLARIIAATGKARFVEMPATTSTLADLRATVDEARHFLGTSGTRTAVFVDEIHRWNKLQQDAFLPHVEDGTIILIGATTENPSFSVNAALLSRARVFVLERLSAEDIETLLQRALTDAENGLGGQRIDDGEGVVKAIAAAADGDARRALSALELAVAAAAPPVPPEGGEPVLYLTREAASQALDRTHLFYDRGGEEHYNIISALHKSMRGSDPDAALYWSGRMLQSGEDPRYVTRRLIRFASEDIGLADPQALIQALAAHRAVEAIGMPECDVAIAQAVVYLAKAPKSNALYAAVGRVKEDIGAAANEPVPLHLRNAPTGLMKDLGYGKGYVYPPSAKKPAAQRYLPDRLAGRRYFQE